MMVFHKTNVVKELLSIREASPNRYIGKSETGLDISNLFQISNFGFNEGNWRFLCIPRILVVIEKEVMQQFIDHDKTIPR